MKEAEDPAGDCGGRLDKERGQSYEHKHHCPGEPALAPGRAGRLPLPEHLSPHPTGHPLATVCPANR